MQRFWNKVNKTGNCWLWTASLRAGYGAFKFQGKIQSAHRFSWFLYYKRFPSALLCHMCDNKLCVNPEHLFEGTHKDNIKDAMDKGIITPFRTSPFNKKGAIGPTRKITYKLAEQIRTEYKKLNISLKNLGNKYHLSKTATWEIVNNVTYIK